MRPTTNGHDPSPSRATCVEGCDVLERMHATSPFGVGHRDVHTDEVWSNDQYRHVLGRSFDECRRLGWDRVIHPDDVMKYITASELLVSSGTPLNLTIRFVRPDGEVRWTKVHGQATIGPSGAPTETTKYVVDVTDELRTQAELAAVADQLDRRNDELESSLDAFHDLRLRLTADGTYVSVWAGDPAALSRPAHELVRSNISADFPPDVTKRFLDAIRVTLSTSDVTTVAFCLGDGEARVHYEARLARVGAGDVMAVIRDVSNVRALEDQLVHAQTMESVGRLAGGVAHDFNNVLHVIRGHASALARHLHDVDATERRLDAIVRAVDRTSSLVDQLMLISRPTPNNPTATVVDHFLLGLRPALQELLGDEIELTYRLHAPCHAVLIDESRFENVILNLTTNAKAAMSGGGNVTVRTRLADHATVVIQLVDDGDGMDADTAARSFDPFFSTKAPGVGTGLGLANVYAAITEAHGSIHVDSMPGRGSTFSIDLPCVDVGSETSEADVNPPLGRAVGATILVVDDDAAVLDLCAELLRDVGHSVLDALSGAAALELIDAGAPIDAVLTDVMMPGMSGPELARAIQQRCPEIPIAFMSGYSAATDDGFPVDPDRILRKPFSDAQLAETVRSALAERDRVGAPPQGPHDTATTAT